MDKIGDKNWTVWVGGVEVRDYLMTHEEAVATYYDYQNMGYTDVKLEKIK